MRLDPAAARAPALDDFANHAAVDAVEIDGDVDLAALAAAAPQLQRIDIRFPTFKDGRGFSLAARIRDRLAFSGELRAVGDLLPDQAGFLARAGFNAAQPDHQDHADAWRASLAAFSHVYQPANDRRPAAFAARHATRSVHKLMQDDITALDRRYATAAASDILRDALKERFAGRVAVLSSFGAEAVVLLHLVASVDSATPVLFLDTDRHFPQTLQHRRNVVARLGLTNVRDLAPHAADAERLDPDGDLWRRDPDACCALRKVRPLAEAVGDYDALITGRKRFHGATRVRLPLIELVDGAARINPLARWSADDIDAYRRRHDLPFHPMASMGYASIGCWPCTRPARDAADPRSGRWADTDKTECGIHAPAALARLESPA